MQYAYSKRINIRPSICNELNALSKGGQMNQDQHDLNQLLQSNLKTYGLNPYDWAIFPEDQSTYVVESLEDPEFSFWAELDLKRNYFQLELRSL